MAHPSVSVSSAASPSMSTASRMRVLVIDDNYDAASALAMLVDLWGYEVEVGYSGFEALEVNERFAPDAILLDIGLPGLSGYEAARRIRADFHDARRDAEASASVGAARMGPAPLLVAVTGYGSADDVAKAFHAGFDHHVLKPSDPAVLERLLQNHSRMLDARPASGSETRPRMSPDDGSRQETQSMQAFAPGYCSEGLSAV